jgi:DNA-binding response OmpR family regulator
MVNGYDSGADIYMTKPIAPEALLAAIDALGRRMGHEKNGSSYSLEMESHRLSGLHGVIALQEGEARVLIGFARAPARLLEMGELAQLFGMDEIEFSKGALMVRMTRLRKKLREVGGEPFDVKVIRGKGYQLTQPLQLI